MNADYDDVISQFTQAGLGSSPEVRAEFNYSPRMVAHAVINHYMAKGYDVPKGGLSETEMDSRVSLKKDGKPAVILVATQVGNRTRANIVDLEHTLAA
jgi:hypothetical protein